MKTTFTFTLVKQLINDDFGYGFCLTMFVNGKEIGSTFVDNIHESVSERAHVLRQRMIRKYEDTH